MTLYIQEHVSLRPYNGMAVDANARYFTRLIKTEDIEQIIHFCQAKKASLFILGAGSNTLFVRDVDGLLVLNCIKGVRLIDEDQTSVLIEVAAGENWHDFVTHSMKNHWFGLENLALIPGTVGAAPIQNIGAYGVEVGALIESVQWYDLQAKKVVNLSKKECQFAYRDSIFKQQLKDKGIIVSVQFRLSKQEKLCLSYSALQQSLSNIAKVNAQIVYQHVCSIRKTKLPDPKCIPNLGSFFKNPIVSIKQLDDLKARYPDLVFFETNQGYKLAAAWLIDSLGWKQKSDKGIQVANHQALVITNEGLASGEDVLSFAKKIQQDVLSNYKVALGVEPVIV